MGSKTMADRTNLRQSGELPEAAFDDAILAALGPQGDGWLAFPVSNIVALDARVVTLAAMVADLVGMVGSLAARADAIEAGEAALLQPSRGPLVATASFRTGASAVLLSDGSWSLAPDYRGGLITDPMAYTIGGGSSINTARLRPSPGVVGHWFVGSSGEDEVGAVFVPFNARVNTGRRFGFSADISAGVASTIYTTGDETGTGYFVALTGPGSVTSADRFAVRLFLAV